MRNMLGSNNGPYQPRDSATTDVSVSQCARKMDLKRRPEGLYNVSLFTEYGL